MTERFEQELNDAISTDIVVGAAVWGINKEGRILLNKAYGKLSASRNDGLLMDTPMWIASSTKLWTAISALQLVARGQLSLTNPVDDVLPELAVDKLAILTGFTSDDQETGEPIYATTKTPITLEMLLTHSSGLSYDNFDPKLSRLRQFLKIPPAEPYCVVGEHARLSTLLYEPGTSWSYSIGTDFAGIMVERTSGLSLGEYFEKNIFRPLQMKDSTMDPTLQPDEWKARLHGRVIRDPLSGKVRDMTDQETSFSPVPLPNRRGGGGGAGYSTSEDYGKILRSLLLDDGILLPRGYLEILTEGRLTKEGREAFTEATQRELQQSSSGMTPEQWDCARWDYSLGGGVVVNAVEGLNGKGMMFWGGMLNNSWYLDREAGIAGFYGSSIVPPGDPHTAKLFASFKRAMFEVEHAVD